MRRLLTCAFLLGASLSACGGGQSFHTQILGQLTLPAGGTLDSIPPITGLTTIDFNQNSDMRNVGVTKDQLSSAVADSVQVAIVSPTTQDFRFLDNLHLIAKAGTQEAEVAQKSGIGRLSLPAPNPILGLDTNSTELKSYVAATSTTFLLRGGGTPPSVDTSIAVRVGIEIHVRGY